MPNRLLLKQNETFIPIFKAKIFLKGVKVVWNSRDLKNGGMKEETFNEARKLWKGWLCQASNIRTVSDINEYANAVIVGTNLMEFAKSLRQ